MLAERALTAVMRRLSRRYIAHGPTELEMLPDPVPGKRYVLYTHVPFCERLCTYCSFNRFLFREDLARRYFASMREEMRMVADLGYDFGSLYVGGGTPTILLDELNQTIDLANELFDIGEVSAETSPNHLTPQVVETLGGRVQRMSVGVQSFDDRLLRVMDRYEKYGNGQSLFESIAGAKGWFPSLNVDMIFNFPSQAATRPRSTRSWRARTRRGRWPRRWAGSISPVRESTTASSTRLFPRPSNPRPPGPTPWRRAA
jgi:coproporphyrinogen III oxidase-like Fe-S oxidoreductase